MINEYGKDTVNMEWGTQSYRGFRGITHERMHTCQEVPLTRTADALGNPITQ